MTLKELHISNLILVDHAALPFEKGFSVISGETGSGKSAILEALQLALGARTDSSLIRMGIEKAFVEAIFDLHFNHPVRALLKEKGIIYEEHEPLIVKRELSSNGKSRAFLNHQSVQLTLLKEIGEQLAEVITQHASHKLLKPEEHRILLDQYAELDKELGSFKELWKNLQELKKEIEQLHEQLPLRLRELETCRREIEEIEEAAFKEGEEEELFQSYSRLASSDELWQSASGIDRVLNADRGVLSLLRSIKPAAQKLLEKDPQTANDLELLKSLLAEAEELSHFIHNYQTEVEPNPELLESTNDRLTLLSKLKKKYGATLDEIRAHADRQRERAQVLEKLEETVETKTAEHASALQKAERLAQTLHKKREKAARELENAIEKELHELNMNKARFTIEVKEEEMRSTGSSSVEFLLAANPGEPFLPLKEAASGGELARVLLAIHLIFARDEGLSTLVFDEIDANIGGTTAAKIGTKLKKLGEKQQVFAVTHFPQVAKSGDHHLHISKKEIQGRTLSTIQWLSATEREEELQRMSGILLDK
ncbi:MAG: DNA repair protein RecN [Parachlamydiaceae bacterium]